MQELKLHPILGVAGLHSFNSVLWETPKMGSHFFSKHTPCTFPKTYCSLFFPFLRSLKDFCEVFPWILFSFRHKISGTGFHRALLAAGAQTLTLLGFSQRSLIQRTGKTGKGPARGYRAQSCFHLSWILKAAPGRNWRLHGSFYPLPPVLSSTREGYTRVASETCYHASKACSFDVDFNGSMLPGRSLMSTQPRNRRASL